MVGRAEMSSWTDGAGVANQPEPPEHTASDEHETPHEGGPETGHPRARGRAEPGRDLPAAQ